MNLKDERRNNYNDDTNGYSKHKTSQAPYTITSIIGGTYQFTSGNIHKGSNDQSLNREINASTTKEIIMEDEQ